MTDSQKTLRNVLILAAIAAAVYFIPGSGHATSGFETALWVAFGGALGFLALRGYREFRVQIHSLGDGHRALLYGGLALGAFEWAAHSRMSMTGIWHLVWWVLLALTVWMLLEVVRRWRSYGGM
jgi:hypothetical protein